MDIALDLDVAERMEIGHTLASDLGKVFTIHLPIHPPNPLAVSPSSQQYLTEIYEPSSANAAPLLAAGLPMMPGLWRPR